MSSHPLRWTPYPAYRDSGVEWLGEVPEHWESRRLKYVASINDDALSESTPPDFEIAYVDISSVEASAGIVAVEEMVFEDAPSRARRVVRDGDTIISTVRTYLRAITPICAPRSNLVVSTGFAVVRPRSVDPGFLSYALRESRFVESIVARSVGVSYPAVNASDVGTIPIPLPSLPEQRAIAAFLDHGTEKLDTLVAKKRALIELLKEKRRALISRTVTRGLPPDAARAAGLDPHPRLTPSGVEWIGDVPEHWGAKRVRHLVSRIGSGKTPTGGAEAYVSEGIMLIRSQNVYDDGLRLDDVVYIDEATDAEMAISRVKTDDLLLNITGASIGRCAIVPPDTPRANVNQHVCIIRPRGILPRFLHAALCSKGIKDWIYAAENGTSRQGLNFAQIGDIAVPIPPTPEQHSIAAFLDRQTAKLDQMVTHVEEAIARLQEYRAALVTAAVTGEIDVRGCGA